MKKQNPFVVDVLAVRSERLSAKEYLQMQSNNPALIDRAEFVPPQPGSSRGFGFFNVRYSARARRRSLAYG